MSTICKASKPYSNSEIWAIPQPIMTRELQNKGASNVGTIDNGIKSQR